MDCHRWIAEQIAKMVGADDDIVAEYCCEMIADTSNPFPKIKEIQIYLTPFLQAKPAADFCQELWELLLSAQASPNGIPAKLLEAKKREIITDKASTSTDLYISY